MSVEDLSETPERKPWRAQPVPSGLVRFERKKSACAMCMLRDSHKVFGEHPEPGVQHSRIVVLSEAPGADEDLQGRPLIGQSGSFFTQCLSHAGIRRDRVWITNVLLCRPPRNDIESVEGSSGKGACVYGLREELDEAWKQGYRVILAQGNTALKELGFEGMNISKYRGSILGGKDSPLTKQGFKPFWVIPTFHPAFLVRNTWKRADGGTIDNTHAYITDLEKARKVSEPGWAPRAEKFLINPSFHEVYKFLEDLIREKHVVFLDIETDGLNPFYAKPVCIGLGRGSGETLVLQQREHSRNGFYWPERDWALLKPLVDEVLHDCPLVLQNAMFDIPFLYWNGFRVNPWTLKYDTAVLHSLVASDSQHNLGVITSMFGTTPYWKESFQGREGSIYAMDKTDLYTYNARDCDVLDQVSKPMLELIAKQDLTKELELQQSLMPVLIAMKIRGVGFENARKEEFRAKFEKYQSELEDSLREIASLPGEFSLSSRVHLRYFLYGYLDPGLAKKDAEFTERISEIEALKADLAAKEAAIETMPGTPAKKRKLLETLRNKIARSSGTKVLKELEAIHNVVHSTEPLAVLSTWKPLTTDSGELSTADDALQAYKHQLTKRAFELERRVEDHAESLKALSEAGKAEAKISSRYATLQANADEELRKIGTLLEWLDKFGEWAEVQKLVSSFTKYTAAPDGRIHPNWNAFGTATGRLSCIGGDERVWTSEGLVPMRRVRPGMKVLTHKGRYRTVLWFIRHTPKEAMRLTLEDGSDIICTSDHHFLGRDGFAEAQVLKELYHISVEEASCGRSLMRSSSEAIPLEGKTHRLRSLKKALLDGAHRLGDAWREALQGRTPGRACLASEPLEDGFEKPDEEPLWVLTPELERALFGQKESLDGSLQEPSGICASSCDGRSSRDRALGNPRNTRSASHRRRSLEQRSGESRSMRQERSSYIAPKMESIARFTSLGEIPVYDLIVEEDHSFVVEGFLAHNCSEPNLQQLPKKGTGKDIRKFFIPRPGYSFVSADLENAEVGIMGCETLDPLVLGAYYEGRNIHDDNTRTLFGIEKGDKLWDAARGAAKIFQFGRYQYGGSIAQIYKQVLMKCRDLNVTLQELTDADERWWEAHPKVKEWSDAIEAEVREKRVIRCESGRIRTFMHNDRDIGKEAKNFRIQGFVGWLANRALVRIERECFEAGLLSREEPEKFIVAPVLQVHDQLVLEARDDFVPWAKEHLSGAMTAPFMYKGIERFLRSDLSVGPSFGDLE